MSIPSCLRVFFLACLALVVVSGCSHDEVVAPDPTVADFPSAAVDVSERVQIASDEIVRAFGWDAESSALDRNAPPIFADDFDQQVLVGSVVQYSADVRVGDGPYDVIRVYRVVDEDLPQVQRRHGSNVFLLHGDGLGFVKFVFGSATPVLPDDQSVAVYLARAGVDVWGMDQNWALVPEGVADLSFSTEWGMQNQIETLDAGLGIARSVRQRSGYGPFKMNLLGYSSGGVTGYAYLNEQTQRPERSRHVGGFVSADVYYKYGPDFEASRVAACEFEGIYGQMLEDGMYDLGGCLADTDPEGDSPIVPGFTNRQTALFLLSVPDGTNFGTPWYHFFAPVLEDGFPVDFAYTQTAAAFDFLQEFVPFEPTAFARDYAAIWCDETDVPWDDFLGEIDVPVLSLGAAGGLVDATQYTLDLLGSTDKTLISVSLNDDPLLDFAHIDLWIADDAPQLVYDPLLQWLEEHPQRPGRRNVGRAPSAD